MTIAIARIRAGLTRKQLADRVGIAPEHIVDVERDEATAEPVFLAELHHTLETFEGERYRTQYR